MAFTVPGRGAAARVEEDMHTHFSVAVLPQLYPIGTTHGAAAAVPAAQLAAHP